MESSKFGKLLNTSQNCTILQRQPNIYNFPFVAGSLFLMVVSSIGLLLNLVNAKLFVTCGGSMPTRVKWLFTNCNLAYIFRSLNLLEKSVYHVCILSAGGLGSFDVPWLICMFTEGFFFCGYQAGYCALFLCSLERLHATLYLQAKDTVGWILYIGSLLIWSESLSLYLIFITSNAHNLPPVLTYCHVNFLGNNAIVNSLLYPVLAIQLATCVAYYGVSLQNKRHLAHFNLTSKSHSLAQRFALWSNVRAARWMLPVSIWHCSIQMLISLISTLVKNFLKLNSIEYYVYLSCQLSVLALESSIHPIICIRNNEFLQRSLHTVHPITFRVAILRWIFYGHSSVAVADVDHQDRTVYNVIDEAGRIVTTTAHVGGLKAPARNVKTMTNKNKKIIDFRQNPDQSADVLRKLWGEAK